MWELGLKEGSAPKNWCFQTMVLEKFLESPLDCKEIKLVDPKGNQGSSQVVLVINTLLANARDIRDSDSIPGSGRSPGGGNGNPLQYSSLENPMDRGAWRATVHRLQRIGHNWYPPSWIVKIMESCIAGHCSRPGKATNPFFKSQIIDSLGVQPSPPLLLNSNYSTMPL